MEQLICKGNKKSHTKSAMSVTGVTFFLYFYGGFLIRLDMKQYIEQNRERFFQELFSILRIPSISAKPEHKPDMERCAQRLVELLLEAGADSAQVMSTAGNPVVYGEKIIDPQYRTILVYGHYDVQPAEPLDKWNTDPFEPVIHDDAIWCRGANDDKGQLFMHIKAFEFMVRTGQLKHNVKFIFEGEEETGSASLPAFIKTHKDLLKADICLVSDTTMISDKVPSINCGMRGLSYLEIKVTGPNKDLHSGHYGGAVANPINVLCEMIASLMDKDNRVAVPGFYDSVVELSQADRDMLARAPFDIDEYKEFLDIDDVREKRDTPRWNVQAYDRLSMSAEYGEATPAREPRPYCQVLHTQRYRPAWFPISAVPRLHSYCLTILKR